jgi:succinyl-diaminopimelate desuccinylase
MDERALTERLIAYDTSTGEGVKLAAGFIKGWLESLDLPVRELSVRGLPVLTAEVGPTDATTTVMFHGHIDVVPGHRDQFDPRLDGDRLLGRGSYDMKGALAAMMLALDDLRSERSVRVRLAVVPDEESEEEAERGSHLLVREELGGDFVITGEPTEMYIGVQSKGILAMRLEVSGTAAHGARPWLGDNAVLKAIDVFRQIESLPFSRQSSELFDRPSINLGRILGGDALNKVPDSCLIDVDIRYLPNQDPEDIVEQVSGLDDTKVASMFWRAPATVDRDSPFVHALAEAVSRHHPSEVLSVGRDGASEAVVFLEAGVPAVEFGPVGGGHHGPEEWVSLESLTSYRKVLVDFVAGLPARLGREGPQGGLRVVG